MKDRYPDFAEYDDEREEWYNDDADNISFAISWGIIAGLCLWGLVYLVWKLVKGLL